MDNVAVGAYATVGTVDLIDKLPARALQCRKTYAQQQCQLTSRGSVGNALVKNFQDLPSMVRRS